MKIKINDTVLIIAGKDAGKKGKVLATVQKKNAILVEGINLQKKHTKARKQGEVSKIVSQEGPIDASNALVICDKCGKATRVGHASVDGKKVRVCKKCGAVLDKAFKKDAKEVKATEPKKKAVRKRAKTTEVAEEVKKEEAVVETAEVVEAPKAKKTTAKKTAETSEKKTTTKSATAKKSTAKKTADKTEA